jgi:hypothetical protein
LPISTDESEITYNKETTLFKSDSDYLGQKKTINMFYDRNMRVEIFATSEGEDDTLLAYYLLEDIEEIAGSAAAKKEDSTTPKVSLSFELSRSHILALSKAEVKFDETVVEEVIPEAKKPETKSEDDSDEQFDDDSSAKEEEGVETLSDLLE